MEILQLKLFSTKLEEQLQFYVNLLGFALKNDGDNYFTIKAGKTSLTFERSNKKHPCYHFAFLIPHSLINSAVNFVESKGLGILQYKGSNTIDFGNGKSVYFYDQDKNIVEFIERPSLGFPGKSPISIDQVIKVNEIGLPVENTLEMSKQLIDQYGIKLIDPDHLSDKFCWIGDFNGAFIVTKIDRNWLPTTIPGDVNDFCIEIDTETNKTHSICFENNILSE